MAEAIFFVRGVLLAGNVKAKLLVRPERLDFLAGAGVLSVSAAPMQRQMRLRA